MNQYPRMSQSIGSPAVIGRAKEDLYLSAVRVRADRVSIRAYIQPLVSWVWFGGILIVLGGLVAALPRIRQARGKERPT